MKQHHLTVADIGTDSSKFVNNIRQYLKSQSEHIHELYVDPYIYEYFAGLGHFSFSGEKLYLWNHIGQKIVLKRNPPEDTTSIKTRHILRYDLNLYNQYRDYIHENIISYINKQSTYVENVFIDYELFNLCKEHNHNLVHSFDRSKIWVKYSRWGRVQLLQLPDELAMLV
jgi:hypothetical protein